MDNPPDFIHLFSRQVWQILNVDYPSVVWYLNCLHTKSEEEIENLKKAK